MQWIYCRQQYIKIFYGIIFVTIGSPISAALVGSDTVVQRFDTQQILNNGDRVAGFAALAAGLGLVSVNTTATFDSFFGVSGPISLNGGKLVLCRDLIMQQGSTLSSMGSVVGCQHNLRLPSLISSFPQSLPLDCTVSLISTTATSFLSNVTSVDWSYDGRFLAIGLSLVALGTELYVYEFNGSTLTLASQASIGILGVGVQSVRWHPSRYSLAVATLSNLLSTELRMYNYDAGTSMLSLSDSAEYGSDLNAVAWHPSGNYLAVGGSSNTQEIIVYQVNSNNTLSSSVIVNMAPNQDISRNALDWDITGSFLAAGATDLRVYRFSPLPSLSLTLNASIASLSALAVDWNPTYSSILAVGLQALNPELRMYTFNSGASSLTLTSSQTIGDSVYSVDWNINGECLEIGTDGGLLSGQMISGASSLLGMGLLLGTLVGTVRWAPDGNYLAVGNNASQVLVYRRNMLDLSSCFTLTDLNVQLTGDVAIKDTCVVFDGRGSINGNGNSLTFDSSCLASIGRSANILFSNMTLHGLQDTQLACLDNAATITFQNMTIVLDADYTFSTGRFDIVGDVCITGAGHSFIYTSTQQSKIQESSTLTLDSGVTFSYAPANQINNAICFRDATSILKLNNATLFATSAGLSLKKGTLLIDGASVLFSQGVNASQAICFGDGISSSNNVAVHFLPAGALSCSGFIVDNNV